MKLFKIIYFIILILISSETFSQESEVKLIENLILNKKLHLNDKIIKSPSHKVLDKDKINLEIPEPKKASIKSLQQI